LAYQRWRMGVEQAGEPEVERAGVDIADLCAQRERRRDLLGERGHAASLLGDRVPWRARVVEVAAPDVEVRLLRHLGERHVVADAREALADQALAAHELAA